MAGKTQPPEPVESEFYDNRAGNSLVRALRATLKQSQPQELRIASGYFTAQGWFALAPILKAIPKVRLLVGGERPLFPPFSTTRDFPTPLDSPQGQARLKAEVIKVLESHLDQLREEYAASDFDSSTASRWRELPVALASPKLQIRQYTANFFHAKAWIATGEHNTLIAGSSNFTQPGLTLNQESNFRITEPTLLQQARDWYEKVWDEGETLDLAELYRDLQKDAIPYHIYIRTLLEVFGARLEDEEKGVSDDDLQLSLTSFQKQGVAAARAILAQYGGVLIADGVGLGKTFLAGEIMRTYCQNRKPVLLLRPAALKSTWDNFLQQYNLTEVDTLSYQAIASHVLKEKPLPRDTFRRQTLDDYHLIVVDEAHNYRNNTPERARVLRQIMTGNRPRQLVLMTATPVNNSVRDLQTLFDFFIKDDHIFESENIYSITAAFESVLKLERAMKEAAQQNKPPPIDRYPVKKLFPIIDALTIKRTRKFIKKHFQNQQIKDPLDGKNKDITFPDPQLKTIKYKLEGILPGFFEEFAEALVPQNGTPPKLTLARYKLDAYRKPDKTHPDIEREEKTKTFIGLLRSGLLKRFESSSHAFSLTCASMRRNHDFLLDAMKNGEVFHKIPKDIQQYEDIADNEDDSTEDTNRESLDNFDAHALQRDVENDRKLLDEFVAKTTILEDKNDPKLKKIVIAIKQIVRQAEEEKGTERQQKNNRKILIFSYYNDTAQWIYNFLRKAIDKQPALQCYKGCIALTSGSHKDSDSIDSIAAARRFSPATSGGLSTGDVECDILIATDVLAEGVNLQQCRHIINYDLPWNPMRLVQRHGRIDRLLSTHKKVFLRTFFPDDKLDSILKLEKLVLNKLTVASKTVGVEQSPIAHGPQKEMVFGRIYEEDGSALEVAEEDELETAEGHRQALREALQDRETKEAIEGLAMKVGSGLLVDNANHSGHFFCARIVEGSEEQKHKERHTLCFVPKGTTKVEAVVSDLIDCLKLIECNPQDPITLSDVERAQAYPAWRLAQSHIIKEFNNKKFFAQTRSAIQKDVRDFLLIHPSDRRSQNDVDRIIKILSNTWPYHSRKTLKEAWENKDDDPRQAAEALCCAIERTGIKPYTPSYRRIDKNNIDLVCWLSLRYSGKSK